MKKYIGLIFVVLVFVGADNHRKFAYENWERKPKDSFLNSKETFELVRKELLEKYYETGISESDLYRAAVKGMLENLDPKMAEWNQLLTPTEYRELESDFKGQMVGAGIEITFNEQSGLAEVLHVIPGTPAEKAGILAGDQVLSVNGTFYKGKQLRDMVYDIRGKVGEARKLSLLRRDKVLTKTVKLTPVSYANVTSTLTPDGIGILSIHYFTGNTYEQIKNVLLDFASKKIKGIVVDLRSNEGGIFESATQSAALLVPKGKTIVKVKRRNKSEEIIEAREENFLPNLPVAVLINGETKSGAEVFAAALKENVNATLVGNKTMGKWSVQTIEKLPNSFAIKYTVGLLYPPGGEDLSGQGLTPDVEVSGSQEDMAKARRLSNLNEKVAHDAQLRTAVGLVQQRL